ncbi:hypothetical protein V6N12_040947 [Hibiscus sabdariffa]|uniref:Uncharacterized protein n=1 Tax=Hibiscus sabdariffa TaxID=183260 RepID=A0ABR2E560_9ROSI
MCHQNLDRGKKVLLKAETGFKEGKGVVNLWVYVMNDEPSFKHKKCHGWWNITSSANFRGTKFNPYQTSLLTGFNTSKDYKLL